MLGVITIKAINYTQGNHSLAIKLDGWNKFRCTQMNTVAKSLLSNAHNYCNALH